MDQAENLRNIIKKNEQPHTARVITVTSGKGGVGKSSVSVNLAIQLSRSGQRVVILDADFGLANIEVMLGLRPKYNLADLMFRGKTIREVITTGPENIGFISGGSGIKELANLSRDQVVYLVQMLYELDSMADVIIIDTGAGISDSVLEFVAASSEVILVTTPEPTSITDAYALLKTLNRSTSFVPEDTVIKMIANRVHKESESQELFDKLSVVVSRFLDIKLELLGSIPFDMNMSKAVMRQSPISFTYPNSISSKAIYEIGMNLVVDQRKDNQRLGIMQMFTNIIRSKFYK